MDLNERSRISFGLLAIFVGIFGGFIALFASKEYVNAKVDPLKENIEYIRQRVDDIYKGIKK
jgi:hypothetical protein